MSKKITTLIRTVCSGNEKTNQKSLIRYLKGTRIVENIIGKCGDDRGNEIKRTEATYSRKESCFLHNMNSAVCREESFHKNRNDVS